jgi:hypothetical protein
MDIKEKRHRLPKEFYKGEVSAAGSDFRISRDTILISFALLSSSPVFVFAKPGQVYLQVFL